MQLYIHMYNFSDVLTHSHKSAEDTVDRVEKQLQQVATGRCQHRWCDQRAYMIYPLWCDIAFIPSLYTQLQLMRKRTTWCQRADYAGTSAI